jgi:dienelactone hydrolase
LASLVKLLRVVIVALMVLGSATACSDDGAGSTVRGSATTTASATTGAVVAATTTQTSEPPAESVQTLRLVDGSRPTPAGTETDELPERTLETWLYLPEDRGPAPLIIFSHGLSGHPTKFERMHTAWQQAGFAVASPAFPLTNDQAEGGGSDARDLENQPRDVIFVLDELLAMNLDESSELFGRFDPDQIGAAGLSLGGVTTYVAAVDDSTRDPRFDAVIIQSSLIAPGDFTPPSGLPVMIMHGSADPVIAQSQAESAYDRLGPPKIFVSMTDAWHADQFEDRDLALTPKALEFHTLVDESTTLFWDAYLSAEPTATGDEVVAAASNEDLTVVESDLG